MYDAEMIYKYKEETTLLYLECLMINFICHLVSIFII